MPHVDQASAQLAAQAYRDNVSPRMARLDRLERFSRGEQYEGRENFFSDRCASDENGGWGSYSLA